MPVLEHAECPGQCQKQTFRKALGLLGCNTQMIHSITLMGARRGSSNKTTAQQTHFSPKLVYEFFQILLVAVWAIVDHRNTLADAILILQGFALHLHSTR